MRIYDSIWTLNITVWHKLWETHCEEIKSKITKVVDGSDLAIIQSRAINVYIGICLQLDIESVSTNKTLNKMKDVLSNLHHIEYITYWRDMLCVRSVDRQLISWFATQPSGRPLTQGQISTILSPTYAYLDKDSRKALQLGSKRRFKGDYPYLEDALFHWQQQMQKKKAVITGDILKAQAHRIWNCLLQYNGEEEPKWSNGWLDWFRRCYNIKKYKQHGEGASAEVNTPLAIQQMDDLRL